MEVKKKISFILPVYNEEKNIEKLFGLLDGISRQETKYDFEFVFVNDGSRDKTLELALGFAQRDPRVRIINFTRNFGHQMALTAGYDNVSGDAVITMDADMQDTPETIPAMIKKWEEGNDVVYAKRRNRHDPWIRRNVFRVYYWTLEHVSDVKMPRNVGDFRLISRRVLSELNNWRDKTRYLRGMVAWLGYKSDYVEYDRPDREGGKSGYSWAKLAKLAFDGFTGYSMFPLKITAYVGMFVIVTGILMFIYTFWDYFFRGTYYPLYKWLIIVVYVFLGIQFILMWLLGEYVGRIHDEQRRRPLYVIDKKYNFDK